MLEEVGSSKATASALSADRVKARAHELGFALAGVTSVRGSGHADMYRAWLERGMHGSMEYLAREDAVARRTRPDEAWPELRSAIVLAMAYDDDAGVADASADHADTGIIARYALSRDYHRVLKAKLLELLRWIEAETGSTMPAARAYVDTGPVLEREMAQRAGLGWFGRNTMLINPGIGSFFFLSALLVEIELEPDAPFAHDRCGTCTRCVDACPTGALLGRDANGAPVMDATRCISYLTIEQRGPIPEELRPLIGNRIYGCDICQEVCPWNSGAGVLARARGTAGQAHAQAQAHGTALPVIRRREASLVELMRMTRDQWDLYTRGSAMRRAGYEGLKRNVAVALGNQLAGRVPAPAGANPNGADGSSRAFRGEAVAALTAALAEEGLIAEHARWALEQTTRTEE